MNRRLGPTQGTISVLVGCHSPVHSLLTGIGWKRASGRWPRAWEWVCIFLHDVGHWGEAYLDDPAAKARHWELGAALARALVGQRGYDLVAGHTTYSKALKSPLWVADKTSWLAAPRWWLVWIQIAEPKLRRPGMTRRQAADAWKTIVRRHLLSGGQGVLHDEYLKERAGS